MSPAGNAAYRLHCAMKRAGMESRVLLLRDNYKRDDCLIFHQTNLRKLYRKIINSIYSHLFFNRKDKIEGSYFFSGLPLIGYNLIKNITVQESDIIYLHWIAGMSLSEKDIKDLCNSNKLIVFFMHDMWDLTAGCHHSFECKQYMTGCKMCPMFFSNRNIHKLIEKKEMACFGENVVFVSPGEWLAGCARLSVVSKMHPVFVIPNIVDQSIFKPLNKHKARLHFNLPPDKKIISFGCISGGNPFKGWCYLRDALNTLADENIHVVVYGGDYNKEIADELKFPVTFVGKITTEEELGLISNVADVFVNPSLCENYSSVLLEHILCKVPVVAFNYTGNPDLVKTGVTGYLAKYKSSEDLSKGISLLLKRDIVPSFSFDYSSEIIIKQHKALICDKRPITGKNM